jgi:cobalt-zinc-cadmium efflux system membrane fusion protein
MKLIALLLCPPLVVFAAGCGDDAVPQARATPSGDGATVTVESLTVRMPLSFTAQLYVDHDAPVLARTTGVIESVHVDLGSSVQEGQLLATLEQVDQEIALARAREASLVANRALVRIRALAESGLSSPADSELARSEATQAELALRQAQRDFDLTQVRAPFSGSVTSRLARPRRLVSPGDSLFRVTALAPLLASVRLPESAGSVTRGSSVQVATPAGNLTGRVVRVSAVVDAASGTREVIVQVAGHASLLPGTTVTVRVGSERRRVLAVPRSVVRDDNYVIVVENGRTQMRPVQLGGELPDGRLEVTGGLTAGERLRGAVP